MDNAILIAIVSSVIAGVFGLVGKYLEINYEKKINVAQQAAGSAQIGQEVAAPFNYGLILKHIGLLQLAANIMAFLVGPLMLALGADVTSLLYMVLFLGTILLGVGFYLIAKSLGPTIPWVHMTVVAIGTGILTYTLNTLILQIPFQIAQFAGAFIQPLVAMGIGGGLIQLIKPTPSSATAKLQPPPVPAQDLPASAGGGGASSSSPHLFGRSGEISTKVFPIDRHEMVIGRGSESHLQLKDPSVSRTHAKILIAKTGVYIRDEKSGIGTFVNGHRISPGVHVLLKHGDMIGIGDKHLLEFRTGPNS